MKKYIKIADRKIGDKEPVFIIAEASANHMQELKRAVRLIEAAKEAGADAVKFQAYTPDTLTIDSRARYFNVKHPRWGGQTLYELYKKAYTPWEWFEKLKRTADKLGIIFFATAYDKSSVDLLEELRVPVHKIASFELVDLPLIEYAAGTKKPLILSTGMAELSEIKEAVSAARKGGARDIALLKCVSSYPAGLADMNLRSIPHMKKLFNCTVGLSDHSLSSTAAVVSIPLGARVIEKHLRLSDKKDGPDSFFSAGPGDFERMVKELRQADEALGEVRYGPMRSERHSMKHRRSLFVVKDVKKGEVLTEDNVRSIRPAYGLGPKYSKKVLGKTAKRDIKEGTPLRFDMIGK